MARSRVDVDKTVPASPKADARAAGDEAARRYISLALATLAAHGDRGIVPGLGFYLDRRRGKERWVRAERFVPDIEVFMWTDGQLRFKGDGPPERPLGLAEQAALLHRHLRSVSLNVDVPDALREHPDILSTFWKR
jgi:hypothetical protein